MEDAQFFYATLDMTSTQYNMVTLSLRSCFKSRITLHVYASMISKTTIGYEHLILLLEAQLMTSL